MVRRLFPVALAFLAACASAPRAPVERPASAPIAWPDDSRALQLKVLNRVAWGASRSSAAEIARLGSGRWLDAQLHPSSAPLPPELQGRIDAMTISQRPLAELGAELERPRRAQQRAAPERELRARADGAAHARRRRRLLAARRRVARARPHRLEHRPRRAGARALLSAPA